MGSAAWQAPGLKQTGAEQKSEEQRELLMWGISEEQEELNDHAGNAQCTNRDISVRDSSMLRMPRANSVSFFSLWIPDPAHRKASKGSLREILTEVDGSSDPVSHHPLVPHPPLCSFPSTAEHVGRVNRERAHHIYRNCLQTLAILANPKPLLYGLFN